MSEDKYWYNRAVEAEKKVGRAEMLAYEWSCAARYYRRILGDYEEARALEDQARRLREVLGIEE